MVRFRTLGWARRRLRSGSAEAPKVSICMPTYNHERYIAQAVESVLSQRTNATFELIIGDDCSTDRTTAILREIASKHPKTIRLRLATRNEGASQNFVGIFAECRGQYTIILEGDDYWTSPDKLQTQIDALDSNPEWAMCFHPTVCVYEGGAKGPSLIPENWEKSEATLEDLFGENFMATSSVMFRSRLFGSLPDWFVNVVIGDWALHFLNAVHGNIGFLPQTMSAYRIHPAGVFSTKGLAAKLTTISNMFAILDHHFQGKFSRQIENSRATTLRWLVGELDNARIPPTNIQTMIDEIERLRNEVNTLETFRARWSDAWLYRIYRETVRPWQRFQQRFLGRSVAHPS